MTLYFAYGSNLNVEQMMRRCPDAVPLDTLYLPNARLVFRAVADVIPEDGCTAPGGLWRITPRCERALDGFEGLSRGTYRKEYVAVDDLPEGEVEVMLYTMNSTGICPPAESYYQRIRRGYKDFGLELDPLRDALRHSWDEKHLTHVERKRLRRNGRPALAGRPHRKVIPPVRKVGVTKAEWETKREAARAAERHSRALKRRSPEAVSPEWKDRVAKASRMNGLSAWLEEQRKWGRMN